ncbi:PilW family protein [Massilia aurea]|uniref:PilW family protein n=1 Tax=Massilia aurea TaxID=373040 RepID=UPI0021635F68|nr:PilW family protein [Massilia aurea]MCS0705960.1 PilW family protein [Massilia aurea]
MSTRIPPALPRAAGFSLVELMVSIVIGLLAVMFATRMMTDSESNKDGALGGSESMQNGMMAMFSISADAEQAGYGLNDPILAGCDTIFNDSKKFTMTSALRGAATVHPLAAAVIVHGNAGPDQLTLYSGSAASGTATVRLTTNYNGGNQIALDRTPYGFAVGDVIVVAPEDGAGQCALAQISTLNQDAPSIGFASTADRFNTGDLDRTFPGSATRVFNLGRAANLPFHTWLVEDGVLRLRATNLGSSGDTAQAVADNIVSLKAQYGFDTRAVAAFDPELGMQVREWSNTMIDADGDGVVGSAGDYQRVAALRIAVIARNKRPERPGAGGACSTTTEALKVFETDQPSGIDAVPVTLDLGVKDDPIDWKCYRYRAFESVVPLRNASWRPTA